MCLESVAGFIEGVLALELNVQKTEQMFCYFLYSGYWFKEHGYSRLLLNSIFLYSFFQWIENIMVECMFRLVVLQDVWFLASPSGQDLAFLINYIMLDVWRIYFSMGSLYWLMMEFLLPFWMLDAGMNALFSFILLWMVEVLR